MFNWATILKAGGSALVAAAREVEGSDAGQTVEADAKKTLSDAASAAVGFVQQNAASAATTAMSDGLAKVGVPSAIAGLLAGAAVGQGETFLGQLVAAI